MQPGMLMALVIAAAVLAAPVLAIIALVQIHRLEKRPGSSATPDLERRLGAIEQRLAELERRSRPAAAAAPGASPGPATAAALPAPPRSVAPPSAPPARPAPVRERPALDLESLIAGRWLNRIGIVALLLAVGFFLKFAFDNQWIGPAGRVAIGLVAGSALLVYSQWLLGRGYRYFSEGIAATGAGSLYLSLYAAWGFYELVPHSVAFGGMIVVTAGLVALAVGRDSERLALLALVGGLMTPGVLGSGFDRETTVFVYLAVLNGGVLAVARARAWRLLAPPALVGTVFYFADWYVRHYDEHALGSTLFFATLFFLEFTALPVLQAWRERRLFSEQYVVVLANASWYMTALHAMLYHQHRWGLTLAVLAMAAVHLAAVAALPRQAPAAPVPVRLLFAGLALTFVTIAIPIRLEGEWITMAWAVEGAVLVWAGFRASSAPMRSAALVLFVLVLLRLMGQDIHAPRTLLNARFATFATAIASFGAAFWLSLRHADRLKAGERNLFAAVAVAANVLAVWCLSLEVWDFFGRSRVDIDRKLAQQMGLSVFWAAWATGLIVAGVRRGVAALRWQGLALIGVAVVKVFVLDLSFLERFYRILSFLALGLVLLVISFLYQRRLFGERAGTKP